MIARAASFTWRAVKTLARIQLWGVANFALGCISTWAVVLVGKAAQLALLKLAASW